MLEAIAIRRLLSERCLFSDVSFTVGPGDTLFVTGPSGVGKTLLLRLLACLDEAQVVTLI